MSALHTIAVITGTRAEFGLLKPVMRAIAAHQNLNLNVLVTGTHLLPPARTIDEVGAEFDIAAEIPMQEEGAIGRPDDARALGRGVSGFADWFAVNKPDVALVLGDRIEPFAAAAAASVAGIHIAHVHGGDRAEGVADESLRHAITKLAHIHLPATEQSANRIIAMGEDPGWVHIVGSPAVDKLDEIPAMPDEEYDQLHQPRIVALFHPTGRDDDIERADAETLLRCCQELAPTVALHPNHDPGRRGIVQAIGSSGCVFIEHLPREAFIGLLRRAAVIVGNSSAGLIEAAGIPIRCIDLGSRQAGRERPAHVISLPTWDRSSLRDALQTALQQPITDVDHPYGDGGAGIRIADTLAEIDLSACPLTKRNTY